jgi:2-keto-4-pentenoate hydratase/2-oxohepta-3-ene-1,7-dioic acid hydratase in catechol pathway
MLATMKLATFEVNTSLGRFSRLGLVLEAVASSSGESVFALIDLNAAYAQFLAETDGRPQPVRWADFLLPPDMRAFLELGAPALQAARDAAAAVASKANVSDAAALGRLVSATGARLAYLSPEVTLKTPVPNPRMLRDFLTFETHVLNGFKRRNEPVPEAWYRMPVYYKGNPNTLIGPDEDLTWPAYSRLMDYELELACVIGTEGRDIPVEEAHRYIAGYAIMNDFSARDVQKGEMACRLGPAKAKDFATAVGPWLVTTDEVPDPRNLRMTARINGEVWSDGNSGDSRWTFPQMIAHVSREETLYPGDILGSGTVGFGCGLELDRWLQPGDTVELEITGLGVLRNRVLASSGAAIGERDSLTMEPAR